MAHDDDSQALDRAYQPSPGLGVAVSDPVQNPGLPPHRARMTDKDPRAEKAAERTVYTPVSYTHLTLPTSDLV